MSQTLYSETELSDVDQLFCTKCIARIESDSGIPLFDYYVSRDNYNKIKAFLQYKGLGCLLKSHKPLKVIYDCPGRTYNTWKKYLCYNHRKYNDVSCKLLYIDCAECNIIYNKLLDYTGSKIETDTVMNHICNRSDLIKTIQIIEVKGNIDEIADRILGDKRFKTTKSAICRQ